ncbi:MAG: glycosyl hydrolase family 65 protein, partial [Phycisphaerae bacterium]|nr:glycosyl hydrolase family 65 protein [Phycisphaerae bacterium]
LGMESMAHGINISRSTPFEAQRDYLGAKLPGNRAKTFPKNAGGYNAINDREGVYKQFRSWARSTNGPFYICNEMGGRKNPKQEIFVSGTGGYMTGLIYGIAGLRLQPEGIQFNPLLPKEWKSLVLKNFHFGDGVYDVTITAGDKIKVKLVSGKANIRIYTAGGETLSEPDK